MIYKNVKFEIASVSNNGDIEGWGAVFNNKDLGGDIIERGAFKRTLKNKVASGKPFPMLWNHITEKVPIGVWDPKSMSETQRGLKVKGRFFDSDLARDVRQAAKADALGGLSIGYDIPRGRSVITRNDDGTGYTRRIKEIHLWEVSPVTFPMNTRARITDVKCTHCGEDSPVWYDEHSNSSGLDNPDADSPLILPADLDDSGAKADSQEPCGCKESRGNTPSAEATDYSSLIKAIENAQEELRR